LLDHLGQRTLDLSQVRILVLDEADRMLDMGFIPDIRRILGQLPGARQNLLFSATCPTGVEQLAGDLLASPKLIQVARRNATAVGVTHLVHPVDRERKRELLSFLIGSRDWRQVLVFTRTKHGADRLSQHLERDGLSAAAIHGNKSQGARTRALSDFKEGRVRVLVATDIAARGLDIDLLPHVVNFDLPQVPEDYVHRIGRTGRAGKQGTALSLVCVDEHGLLRDIERLLEREIERVVIAGYAPDPSIRAEPILNGRASRGAAMPRPAGAGARGRGPRSAPPAAGGPSHGPTRAQPDTAERRRPGHIEGTRRARAARRDPRR
jgi:ATP-dependent RNA helicase RhlE